MSIYKNIKINGTSIPRPPEFAPKREDVFAAEITTCTGKTIADRIGWKFSELELKWPALTQPDVDTLVSMPGFNTITFDDADGVEHTENIIVSSKVWMRQRQTKNGQAIWSDVSVGVKFADVHND